MKKIKVIKGDEIILRPLEEKDLEMVRTWRNQDHIRSCFINSEIISPEQQKAWYHAYCQREGDLMFIIEETIDLKKPVGTVSLYNIDPVNKSAEFGRLMIGELLANKKGLAFKASVLICNYGFETLGLEVIYLNVFKDNSRAINIYHKLGFIEDNCEISEEQGILHMVLLPSNFLCK